MFIMSFFSTIPHSSLITEQQITDRQTGAIRVGFSS